MVEIGAQEKRKIVAECRTKGEGVGSRAPDRVRLPLILSTGCPGADFST